jgi:hypothetical protein
MAWFDLQSHAPDTHAAFDNADAARTWLGGQSQTVPARMQLALAEQFEAIAAAALPAIELARILEALRNAAHTAHTGAAKRYSFQARPLNGEAAALFAGSVRMWQALAVGYLSCLERLGGTTERDPGAIATAAHRAMVTLRLCLEDHYLAGVEPSVRIWKNVHRLLQIADALHVSEVALGDPEFRDPAETTLAEHYCLIMLTAVADPYSLTDSEFTVMRRAFTRWRNLATFAANRDEVPRTRWLRLDELPALPPPPSPQTPQWLEISGVRTKIRHRLRALDEGQTPEELHFGRDLSARGCRELLEKLLDRLKPASGKPTIPADRNDKVKLAATTDDCFELIAGRPLKLDAPLSTDSNRVAHDRIAIFGTADQAGGPRLSRAGELWTLVGETIDLEDMVRPAGEGSARLLPGHLLTIGVAGGSAILGVADRVMVDREQLMRLRVRRFPGQPLVFPARSAGAGGPINFVIYLLPAVEAVNAPASYVLPSGVAIRIKQAIFCESGGPGPLYLGELLERGENFERYLPGTKNPAR